MVQSAEVFSRVCTIFGSNLVQKAEKAGRVARADYPRSRLRLLLDAKKDRSLVTAVLE